MAAESLKPRVQPPFWRMMIVRVATCVVLLGMAALPPPKGANTRSANTMPGAAYAMIAIVAVDALCDIFRRLRDPENSPFSW